MILENLLELTLVAAIIFALLWLVIEAGTRLGDVIMSRKAQRAKARRHASPRRNSTM